MIYRKRDTQEVRNIEREIHRQRRNWKEIDKEFKWHSQNKKLYKIHRQRKNRKEIDKDSYREKDREKHVEWKTEREIHIKSYTFIWR